MEIIKSNDCFNKINDRLLIHYIKNALKFQPHVSCVLIHNLWNIFPSFLDLSASDEM